MDPTATWEAMAEAVAENDWANAAELADNLIHWLAKGGFPPIISGVREFDRVAAKATAEAICAWEFA